jgi:hypothetical protein
VQKPLQRLNPADFHGRLWATRKGLWVDRMASAWLIRRFIDPEPRFLWLDRPENCPADAVGFDFDGATFTHVDHRVTFETLIASFGLDQDPALVRFGALVHYLDAGGVPVPEAAGLDAILSGARRRCTDDDALLAEVWPVFESMYATYGEG